MMLSGSVITSAGEEVTEVNCNQGREAVCIQMLLDMAKEFYFDPQNRKSFEVWKKQREMHRKETHK